MQDNRAKWTEKLTIIRREVPPLVTGSCARNHESAAGIAVVSGKAKAVKTPPERRVAGP